MDSEDYVEDDFLETDDPGGYAGLGAGFDKPAFEEANFKYAKSMSGSPYLIEIVHHIVDQPLLSRYKESLVRCVYTLFTEEQVLADNHLRIKSKMNVVDPLEKKLIFAQRNIELTRLDATKYDMRVINTYSLEKYIFSVYEAYLTRTIGDKRERIINAEIPTRSINQVENVTHRPEYQQMPKKNKLFGLGR